MIGGALLNRAGLQELMQHKGLFASSLALVVHVVGLVGMVFIDRDWFASLTSLNLLLMSLLLIWTQASRGAGFYLFLSLAFLVGMSSEIIGVNTGLLFGTYAYGGVMGLKWMGVPLIIGMNWFVVVFSAAATMHWLVGRLMRRLNLGKDSEQKKFLPEVLICIGAAILAVAFDWVMEPAAIQLGFWAWAGEGDVPFSNYLTWFLVALLLITSMRLMKISLNNIFPVHLFFIQAGFFIMIRVLL